MFVSSRSSLIGAITHNLLSAEVSDVQQSSESITSADNTLSNVTINAMSQAEVYLTFGFDRF